jgi:hypothetical protein
MNLSRSSIGLHAFQGILRSSQKARLCNPCLRNELSPFSQEGHRADTLRRTAPAWARSRMPFEALAKKGARVCTPIGRGSALRAHSVAVRVGPDAPILPGSVTHLVRRPDCLSGERDSISLRSARDQRKPRHHRNNRYLRGLSLSRWYQSVGSNMRVLICAAGQR